VLPDGAEKIRVKDTWEAGICAEENEGICERDEEGSNGGLCGC
jgi:hypothetical protein